MTLVASPTWQHLFRQDVIPVLTGYLAFLGAEVAYARSRANARQHSLPTNRSSWHEAPVNRWRFVRYLASIVVPGYIVFLAIVVVFYFALGDQPRSFIADALAGGSLLTFAVAVPGLVLLTLLNGYIRRRQRPD